MSVRRRRPWSELLLRPQVLVGFMALVTALSWFVGGFDRAASPTLPQLLLDAPPERLERTDVPIVVVDRDGLQRTQLVEVEAAGTEVARLQAALTALRDTLVDAGDWPAAVAAPRVYGYELQRRRVAVIDVSDLVPGARVDLLSAWAVLRSLRETAFAHGVDDVEVVVDGAPAASLWGQVALR